MATLIEAIDKKKREIIAHNSLINQCTKTQAGILLAEELRIDRRQLVYQLGLLVSNSAVRICLQ